MLKWTFFGSWNISIRSAQARLCSSNALKMVKNYGWTVSKMFRHLYAVCQYSSWCMATPSHSKMLSAPAPNPAWYQPCCRWNAWCAGRDHRREWLKGRHRLNSLPWLLKSTAFHQRMTWGLSLSQKASSMILDSHGEMVRPQNLMTWKPNRNYMKLWSSRDYWLSQGQWDQRSWFKIIYSQEVCIDSIIKRYTYTGWRVYDTSVRSRRTERTNFKMCTPHKLNFDDRPCPHRTPALHTLAC